jgi:hypothetical protein
MGQYNETNVDESDFLPNLFDILDKSVSFWFNKIQK